MRRALLLTGSLVLAASTFTARAPAAATGIVFTMQFDGGYAFIRQNGAVHVDALKSTGGPSVDHRMWMTVDRGTPVGTPPQVLDQQRPSFKAYDLTGVDLKIDDYGTTTGAVTLPNYTPVLEPYIDCYEPSYPNSDGTANNMYFMPVVGRGADVDEQKKAAKIGSRILLDHGRLAIIKAFGCWDLKTGGTSLLRKQALVRGQMSVKLNLNLPTTTTFKMTLYKAFTTTAVGSIAINPDTQGEVVLSVGHFCYGDECPKTLPEGAETPHFSMFYDLLSSEIPPGNRIRPYKHYKGGAVTPGDECPPGFFF